MFLYNLQSSANNLHTFPTSPGRSFMKMMNIMGPSIDPWGIPDNTLVQSDAFPFITTLCLKVS